MKASRITMAVAALLLAAGAVSSYGAVPSFQGLGDLPDGSHMSWANAISADGSTVVGGSVSADGTSEAFVWTRATGIVALGKLPGAESTAKGVSANGSVIVGTAHLGRGGEEAFRWTAADGMVGLGSLDGGERFYSNGYAVSADGSTIVGESLSGSGYEAFRWTQQEGMVGLGDLAGGDFASRPYAVSSDGSVIVGSGVSESHTEAFRWTADGGMVGLGWLSPNYGGSVARGVSADGSIVVGQSDSSWGGGAFRWMEPDGMDALPYPKPGFKHGGYPLAISADGSVVVGSDGALLPGGYVAVIWEGQDSMRNLNDVLVEEYGLDLQGWNLTHATGISADGTAIVGWGTNPNGDKEAWIFVVPEPGTLSLLAFGGLALIRRRTQR